MQQAIQRSPDAQAEEHTLTEHLLHSFNTADAETSPYPYWVMHNMLPAETLRQVLDLPIAVPDAMLFSGSREANNAKRVYFSKEAQAAMPVCKAMVDAFKSPEMIATIEKLMSVSLKDCLLRIEYCQDTDGFWLAPHADISVKRFSMLLYLSDDPQLHDAGTDIFDDTPQHNLVRTIPYICNDGMAFIPAHNTWHGFHKRPIKGVRKCLILNYVTPEWRATEELA